MFCIRTCAPRLLGMIYHTPDVKSSDLLQIQPARQIRKAAPPSGRTTGRRVSPFSPAAWRTVCATASCGPSDAGDGRTRE